jgi:hypothetical protein
VCKNSPQRPDVWKHKPEEFMDASFIAELEKNRFYRGSSRPARATLAVEIFCVVG